MKNAVGSKYQLHLGGGQYVETTSGDSNICFTEQLFESEGQDVVVDCSGTITVTEDQFDCITEHLSNIENALPELNIITPCYNSIDHQTPIGRLSCKECNPTGYFHYDNDMI